MRVTAVVGLLTHFSHNPLSARVITVDFVVCVCVLLSAISHWTMGNLKTQALPHFVLSPESLLQSKCPIICMSNKALKNMNFNYRLLYPISSFKVLPLLNGNTVRCYIWWDLHSVLKAYTFFFST